ncbi:two-component system, chemotaxis family, sensor kinase CheA [Thermanaeromonas toyohensis ToBE]|uniref:Chemotaxis protein CheA n=1 Tax=Thermanaeromonas toyohensis ToBE TaxID=698762 RepID=A0A1W1VKM6_9FIRM|nr:chemotaxis protein CheA [Thermanaeromonas toyohensis]SMB93833.1 two-component system, chemotaxis family, sensor kinase CheA [Thermanaeromonas toyohensis ToBE]
MNGFNMSQYLSLFLDEAEEQLQQLDEAIVLLEQEPSNRELLNKIFRIAHTLKGSSASMGFEKMATLTHRMESVLDALRQGKLAVTPTIVDLLLACLDKLKELKNELSQGQEGEVDTGGLVQRLEEILAGGLIQEEAVEPSPFERPLELDDVEENVIRAAEVRGWRAYEIRVELEPDCRMKGARAFLVFNNLKDLGEVIKSEPHTQELEAEKFENTFRLAFVSKEDPDTLANVIKSISEIREVTVRPIVLEEDQVLAPQATSGPSPSRTLAVEEPLLKRGMERRVTQTVRVDVQRLESLMNLVGELVIDRTRLAEVSNNLRSRLGNEELVETLDEISTHIGRITSELQEEIMKARMFPIDQVFNRFPRMVRDLAHKAGKEIEFIVEGRETELDRTVIEEIGDPLIHLLRNAIDHGIESPEERVRLGKPRYGTIILKAFHQENQIVITVQDDGRGMDPEALKRRAIEQGLLTPEAATRLTKREALDLIFLPGFSTSERVTDVSGRGVGMDIVKAHLEKINGTIDIQTTPGVGTCFTIKLPLTLAINRSLLVTLEDQVYALPLANVVEIIEVEPQQVRRIQQQEVVVLRGQVLPLVHLARALGIKRNYRFGTHKTAVVIVGLAEKRVGFIVDTLIGEQEIVIKSLGNYIGKIPGIAGATIMGDGRVALILDVHSLLSLLETEAESALAS